MRNLVLHEVTSKTLNASSEENLVVCYGHNERSSTGELYVCGHNLAVTNFDESGVKNWTADLSDLASPGNEPVNITFLTLPNALCVGLANGELLTISGSGDNSTLAGVCDNGLLTLEWSPDQELVVLVTKDLNTILMSCMFDPIHEVNLLSQEFGDKQFITVGWGKKETQFHGSEGKQARVKSEVSADPNTAVEDVKITWRGDGQLYAVGFTMEGIRRFKVFDREGQLQYTSEKQQGLESNLSWRPSGNVIASTQRLPDQYEVAFFEKNGLKHGGFTIPVKNTTHVEDIAWSSDSEIIAIQCHDKEDNAQTVMLFTSGNYHWYLKQILCFTPDQKISKLLWDNDFDVANNKKLHVLLKSGEFYSYTWVWDIDHSKGKNNDDAIVAVVNDKKILLTGFRQAVVPPPMCSLEIELDSFVNSIHFAPKDTGQDPNMFFVTTSDNRILFYEQTNKCPLQYKLAKSVSFVKYEFPFQYYNWHWLNNDIIVCVAVKNDAYNLLEYKLGSDALTLSNSQPLPTSVTKCHQHPEESQAMYLLLSNGEIVEYYAGGNIVPQDTSFPTSCPKFCVLSINNKIHFLGLSHKGNLYLDDGLIMNNVSSFFVHTHFLLLTTLKHYLLCAELTQNGLDAIKDYQKNESPYVYKRKVERGSKLVIAVANDTRTVFQMPRGNLEAIQPRPLSLKIIGEHLDLLKYHDAFDLMRKQRINLNLFYDHDPEKFMQNIEVFLDQIDNNSWLSLFISDLENVDVTHTMYSSSYADKVTTTGLNASAAKIGSICVRLREALEKREDRDSKILPLLTTLVKMNTIPDLEGALTIIKKLKEQETAGARLPVGSDEALKYLLYMVEVNKLFDVSLGMYDFDLVLLVANKSQKDPKEFIPMLNELNEMEEQYKRFSINKHLKRFDRAVQCLAKCGPEKREELKSFVKYHSLYQIALPLFEPDEEIYRQMSDDFGLHLKLKKLFTEAGIVYRRAKNYVKAIECFKEALEWELAVDVAQRSKMPEKEFVEFCRGLISDLRQANRHKEAILLLEQYSSIHDHQEIVDIAVESGNYKTALMLCTKYNLENCIETKLRPAVLSECTNLQQSIAYHLETFTRHTLRLSVVRTIKSNRPAESYDPSYANKDSDLYSDAGSTLASSTSRSSSKSFRSSKNRRKHERKVCSLKEGSQYEEVGLLMALYNQVTSAQELRGRVQEVCLALSYFGKDEEAALLLLQDTLEKLFTLMKESQKLIWTSEILLEATNADIAARDVPEGFRDVPQGMALLDVHMRIPPPIRDVKWKLEGLD